MATRIAYSYVRFSSKRQAAGDSVRRQTQWRNHVCEKYHLALDQSLKLTDLGVSAFRGKNIKEGALAGFLKAIQLGKVPRGSVLLVESLDRLSRAEVRPALTLFMGILEAGVSILTRDPEREYKPEDQDPITLIEPLLVFARANEESRVKSMRRGEQWKALRAGAKEGLRFPMKLPCWLALVDGNYAIVEEKAEVVRRIFQLAAAGNGCRMIAGVLNRDGVRPFGWGKRWGAGQVQQVIVSTTCIGEFTPCRKENGKPVPEGPPIPNYFPAVVAEADFFQVRARAEQRKRSGRNDRVANLFTGVMRDAHDGELMVVRGQRTKPRRASPPYFVSTASVYEDGKRQPIFWQSVLERAILRMIYELRPADVCVGDDAAANAEAAEASGRVASLTHRIEVTEKKALTAEDFETYLDLIQKLKDERGRWAAKLQALRVRTASQSSESLGEVRTLIEMMDRADDAEKLNLRRATKARLRDLVREIWVLAEEHETDPKRRVAHVQLFLHDGSDRYGMVCSPRDPDPSWARPLKGVDLREWRQGGLFG